MFTGQKDSHGERHYGGLKFVEEFDSVSFQQEKIHMKMKHNRNTCEYWSLPLPGL